MATTPPGRDTRSKGYICLRWATTTSARLNNQRTTDDPRNQSWRGHDDARRAVPLLRQRNRHAPVGERCRRSRAATNRAPAPAHQCNGPAERTSVSRPPTRPSFTCRWIQLPTLPNVAAEEKDPNSLLNRVRKLIRLKHTEPALAAYAEFVPLYAKENTYPFVYARASGEETLLMISIRQPAQPWLNLTSRSGIRSLKLLAGKELHTTQDGQTLGKLRFPGQTYAIYQAVEVTNGDNLWSSQSRAYKRLFQNFRSIPPRT